MKKKSTKEFIEDNNMYPFKKNGYKIDLVGQRN